MLRIIVNAEMHKLVPTAIGSYDDPVREQLEFRFIFDNLPPICSNACAHSHLWTAVQDLSLA
jgi:hypothetical protein